MKNKTSLCICFSLSAYLCLSLSFSLCLFLCLSPSFTLYLCLFVSLFAYLCVCLSLTFSLCSSLYVSVCCCVCISFSLLVIVIVIVNALFYVARLGPSGPLFRLTQQISTTLLSPSGERRYYLGRRNRRFEFSSEASFRLEDLLHASKSTNMGQPALLPLRGRRTKDFFAL